MNNEKGITLAALIITVIVIIIIASIAVGEGGKYISDFRLQKFNSELELAEQRVKVISEKIKNGDTSYNDIGTEPTVEQKQILNDLKVSDINNFKFYNKENLKKLDILDLTNELLINFNTNQVVSTKGISVSGKKYYTLEDDTYDVEYNSQKNVGAIDFEASVIKLQKGYKFTITQTLFAGNVKTSNLEYKLSTASYYNSVGENNTFIVYDLGTYNIKLSDYAGNSKEKKYTVSVDNTTGEAKLTLN